MNTLPLTLDASCDKSPYNQGEPIPVEIKLRNVSSRPIWINKRMGMGYEDGIIRELFFTVYDATSGQSIPIPNTERVDVHRLPPTRREFQQLASGEAIAVIVNILDWYPLTLPGNYRIVFTYDNEFDGQEFGIQAFTGTVPSNPVELMLD